MSDWVPTKGDLVSQLNTSELLEVKKDWEGPGHFVFLIRPNGEISGTMCVGREWVWLDTPAEERVAKALMGDA